MNIRPEECKISWLEKISVTIPHLHSNYNNYLSIILKQYNILMSKKFVDSREAAFIYAIEAAGVMYSVTRACSKGELSDCSCDNHIRTRRNRGNWQWGGCSEVKENFHDFIKSWIKSQCRFIKSWIYCICSWVHANPYSRHNLRKAVQEALSPKESASCTFFSRLYLPGRFCFVTDNKMSKPLCQGLAPNFAHTFKTTLKKLCRH